MKQKLLLVWSLLVITIVSAQNFSINGINYTVISGTTNVEVAKNMEFSGALVLPSTVINNSITYLVTSIGANAFYQCYGLNSVTIPNSVTSISGSAFYKCTGLTSLTIPDSVTIIETRLFIIVII